MSWIAARCGAATSLSAAASAIVPSVMRCLSASRAGTVTTLNREREDGRVDTPGATEGASPAGAVRRRGHLIQVIAGKPRRDPFLDMTVTQLGRTEQHRTPLRGGQGRPAWSGTRSAAWVAGAGTVSGPPALGLDPSVRRSLAPLRVGRWRVRLVGRTGLGADAGLSGRLACARGRRRRGPGEDRTPTARRRPDVLGGALSSIGSAVSIGRESSTPTGAGLLQVVADCVVQPPQRVNVAPVAPPCPPQPVELLDLPPLLDGRRADGVHVDQLGPAATACATAIAAGVALDEVPAAGDLYRDDDLGGIDPDDPADGEPGTLEPGRRRPGLDRHGVAGCKYRELVGGEPVLDGHGSPSPVSAPGAVRALLHAGKMPRRQD